MRKSANEITISADSVVKVNVGIVRYQFNDGAGNNLGIVELRFPTSIDSFHVPESGTQQQLFHDQGNNTFIEYLGTVESTSHYTSFDSSKNLSQSIYIVCENSRVLRES